MKLPDESGLNSDLSRRPVIIYSIAGVSFVVFLVLIIVVSQNTDFSSRSSHQPSQPPHYVTDDDIGQSNSSSSEIPTNGIHVDDLDFWDQYPIDDDTALGIEDVETQVPIDEPPPPDPSEDGRHTLVERRNGTSEWVRINPYIIRNTYDPLGFVLQRDRMTYFENDRAVSFLGIDLSRHDGVVDFARVKNDGIDFVILRLGARGYETGRLSVDENFFDNLDNALENGLHVGIYFFSQAITTEEVIEEATLVIESLAGRRITYPVIFSMDYIAYDSSRIDQLSRAEKTDITDSFCNFISGAGYVPMIYGTKEWLIEQIDLTRLMNYDVWLSQSKDLPDYPYKFQIWQYTHRGSVAGIRDTISMNISFVDYSAR